MAGNVTGYKDGYRQALTAVIEAKAEGRAAPTTSAPEAPAGEVVDLMAALQASVRKAQARRAKGEGDAATVHEMPEKKAASKETAKAPARKTMAKKTITKKTGPRKPRRTT
ncbi:hypothetical protein ACFU53_13715 [Streptomyces sp. NPDC057474]|uniref:hypothetical protein n=1 Tax=Streptomyces sp. NPDC057474 TaxID=3346144 RepID=UPI0036C00973